MTLAAINPDTMTESHTASGTGSLATRCSGASLALMCMLLGPVDALGGEPWQTDGLVGYATDYVDRGISQSDGHGSVRGEIGWILEDNQGMVAIADAIESKVNKEYNVYAKAL